jgi:hypothetical protein
LTNDDTLTVRTLTDGGQSAAEVAGVTVADDVVFLGSFNLSRSGELNAENVLEIEDAAPAERQADYADRVRALYPRFVPRPP